MHALKTVRAVIEWHINRLGLDKSPSHHERVRILRLFCDQHGKRHITTIDPDCLTAFINGRGFATWTRRRWCITVKTPFCCAVKAGRIPFNPFWEISVDQGERGRDITREEWQRLMRAANPRFRRILVFLRFTGARPGELRALMWDMLRIGTQSATLKIHKTSRTQKKKKPRRIALCRVAAKLLAWIRRHSRSAYVFTNNRNKPWTTGTICCHLRRLRERVGLPSDVKLYSCRHAYGTGAILNTVDIATLAELMGHASTTTTEYYVHLTGKDDHLTEAAERATKRIS